MAAIYEPGKCNTGCNNYINATNGPNANGNWGPFSMPACSSGSPPCNTFGNCTLDGQTSLFSVPNTVPIKTALQGSSISPWVKIRFESQYVPWANSKPGGTGSMLQAPPDFWDFTEITTGNISQPGCNGQIRPKPGVSLDTYKAVGGGNPNSELTLPKYNNPLLYEPCTETCRAAIKSFQYSWGTIDSGNKCRVTIVDELGSSINAWIGRLFRNPTNTPITPTAQVGSSNYNTIPLGVYKMKVTFGWLIIGGEANNACPISGDPSFYGPAYCTPTPTASLGYIGNEAIWNTYTNPTSANTRLICSPPLWFLPDQLSINNSNGKFIYEIEGIDLMMAAQYQPSSRTYGSSTNKMHFVLAVKKLAAESLPPFDVDFLQVSPSGTLNEPLLFSVNPNTANIPDYSGALPLQPGNTNQTDTVCLPASIDISDIPDQPTWTSASLLPNPNAAVPGKIILQSLLDGPINAVDTDAANSVCRIGYLRACERLGPLDVWPCHELGPLHTIHQWLNRVTAQGLPTTRLPGESPQSQPPVRGIDINYDPSYTATRHSIITHGKVILWANPYPHCAQLTTETGHIKGLYVIGGPCSPVLSFNQTQMKWPFQAALAAGGTMGTGTAAARGATDARLAMGCRLPGRGGGRSNTVVTSGYGDANQRTSTSDATVAAGAHRIANLVLSGGIEAELKVQGDPSDYLCSPISGFGKSIALIVLNPYYVDNSGNSNECNLRWSTLTTSSCNSLLTNRNWYIMGVDHQIKEGSYITTYKLRLFAPNAEVNPTLPGNTPVSLGGEVLAPVNSSQGLYACAQGTIPCIDDESTPYGPGGDQAYIAGPVGTGPGADTFCESECSMAGPM